MDSLHSLTDIVIAMSTEQTGTKKRERIDLGGERGSVWSDCNDNLFPERRIYWEGRGPYVVSRAEDLKLTDEEIREKWSREQREAREARDKKLALEDKLRGLGLSKNEINNLKPFQEWGTEDRIARLFVENVWDWNFKQTKQHPATVEELAFLKKAINQAKQLKADEGLKYGHQNTRVLIAEDKAAHAKAALAGEKNPPRIRSEDECYEALKEARLVVNKEISRLSNECAPILERIAARLLKVAGAMADELQGDELEAHAKHDGKYGWPYVPSRTVITLRQMEWRVQPELMRGNFWDTAANLGLKI